MLRRPNDALTSGVRIRRHVVGLFLAIAGGFVLLTLLGLAFAPLYDNWHLPDTVFLLAGAWRVHEGLVPVRDFGHFYPLMIEALAALMRLTGAGVHLFDIFALSAFTGLVLAMLALLHGRTSGEAIAMLTAILAMLVFTRHPLEIAQSVTSIVSAHSFLYNRLALALAAIMGLWLAAPRETGTGGILRAALAGALLGLVVLVKVVFAILVPAVLIALLIQRRWRGLAGLAAGLVAILMVLDPGLARATGSLAYAMAHVADEAPPTALLGRVFRTILSQPLAVLITLSVLGILVVRGRIADAAALVVFTGGLLGMSATMGLVTEFGHIALAIAAIVTLAAATIAVRDRTAAAPMAGTGAILLTLALTGPHLLNLAAATAKALTTRETLAITAGPFADYASDAPHYDAFAEGIAVLDRLDPEARHGVIADGLMSFEYARRAPPVAKFPLWLRHSAPELVAGIPDDADIAMVSNASSALADALDRESPSTWVSCTETEYWTVLRRDQVVLPGCDG